jgi:putative selenium metabolism protein SsnA
MLITNARLGTLGDEPMLIEDGALLVEGQVIAALGTSADLVARHPNEERWDARNQLVLPAAICAHTHFYGAFARGFAPPGRPAADFRQKLERLWWSLDRALTLADVRASSLACLVDAVRHGTTTLIDHHASPMTIDGSLDVIADAVQLAGLRACLCYEVSDRHGPEYARAGIAENVRFAESLATRRYEQLSSSFGLHASLTLSDETLAACVSAGREAGLGFHVHTAEDAIDQEQSLQAHGKRVVQRLADAGVLGPATIAVHCVHVDESEIQLLAQTSTHVTHQPRSNMNNGVGTAPVEAMLEAGVNVGLGNDGFSNNMLAEMKAAFLVHKLEQRDPRAMPAETVTKISYANNAAVARTFWPDLVLGKLEVGASADLVFMDYTPPTPLTAANLPYHLMFGVEASAITGTMCAGRTVMRDRSLRTLDEPRIMAEASRLASAVWERIGQQA